MWCWLWSRLARTARGTSAPWHLTAWARRTCPPSIGQRGSRPERRACCSVWEEPVTTVAGLEVNTLADGLFHLSTWLFVLAGMLLTIRAWQQGRLAPTWRFQIGLLLAGWGIFNLVEGVIDHQILNVHHVRDDLGAPLSWDIGFLVFGALLLASGWALHAAGRRDLETLSGARR